MDGATRQFAFHPRFTLKAMNAPVFTTPSETSSPGSHPSDKEIALLAFKHWKKEGCSHLRPEHWLNAEKELLSIYAAQGPTFAPAESERLEEFWEQEMEAISCYVMDSDLSLATKGWS
jgi:hypothetical protein